LIAPFRKEKGGMIWITWNFLTSLDDATQFVLLKLNMEEKKKNT
jgi:hypothetical protein